MEWKPIEELSKRKTAIYDCFIGLFEDGTVYPFFIDHFGPLGVEHTRKSPHNPLKSIMTGWSVYPTHFMPLPEPPKESV